MAVSVADKCSGCGRPVPDLDSPGLADWQLDDDGTATCPDCLTSSETAAEEDAQTAQDARHAIEAETEGGSVKVEGGDI